MNTTNKLTMLWVALTPMFLILFYLRFPFHMYFALTVFILANVTNFVSGYIACHYNQATNFDKFMDPLANKVLVIATPFWFVEAGRLPAWVPLVIIMQELAVTALWLVAVEWGRVIAAVWSSKVKTVSTMVYIRLTLLIARSALDLVYTIVILVTTVHSGAECSLKNKGMMEWSNP